jgi:DNA polymerase (family 10)
MTFYVELKAQMPPAVVDLMNVAGIGPKLAVRLHKELGVSNMMELADLARRGEVAKLRGFGPKRQSLYASLQGPAPTPPAAPQAIAPLRLVTSSEQPLQDAA